MVRDAVDHPAFKLTVGTATAANSLWLQYINDVTPLVSFLALVAGLVYVCFQIAHLVKHWNIPPRGK